MGPMDFLHPDEIERRAKEAQDEELRLTYELESFKDKRAQAIAGSIYHLGDSLSKLAEVVSQQKQPVVVNLIVSDPSDPKVRDFVDKIVSLKEQGKL